VYFAPVVTTLVAVAIVWRYLYQPQYGLVNALLGKFGIPRIDWLGDPHWALPAILVLAVWKNFGYNLLIFVAGLQNVPRELHEAAELDGASGWQRFWNVTLPDLAPVFLFVSVTTMINYFQCLRTLRDDAGRAVEEHEQPGAAHVRTGFRWWRLGYAAALAFILFAVILGATAVQMRLQQREGTRMKPKPGALLLNAILIVGALLTVAPLLWMLSASFMPTGQANSSPPPLLPSRVTFEHYRELFTH
jgi:multiple sugar transport system permease protein